MLQCCTPAFTQKRKMALILTFLGKGGTGRTTIAIAAAKRFACQGRRVLLAASDPSPALGLMLGTEIGSEPKEIAPNLKVLQLQMTVLLERGWEELKKLEAQYLRTPFFKDVYGQELGVLPGMDSILTINAMREYQASGEYDVIIYDGEGNQTMLRAIGSPEILSWYIRRFRKVFTDSELGKTLSPFVQPITSAILNVDWSSDNFSQPLGQFNQLLDKWKETLADANRVVAYLVTTNNPVAVATARYLWGSAQQVGLIVGGVILNQTLATTDNLSLDVTQFAPLQVTSVPFRSGDDWQSLCHALPDFSLAAQAPKPISIDVAARQVSLFLPGFDKKQIKLTQYGPEVTIEAGDQRRNIFLPPELSAAPVKGAKFQNQYLIISFG